MKNNKAFSLIELSIVILIIGILIAGVTQSSRLVEQFRIKTAQSLTQSSPANSIFGMVSWYETSMDSSFLDNESQNQHLITRWNDINVQSTNKNNATQDINNITQQPTYRSGIINGLPVVRFDGTNDLLNIDGSSLVGSDYTIFVVEQRLAGVVSGIQPFLGGTGSTTNANLHIGYRDNSFITQAQFGNDLNVPVDAFSSPTPTIHSFRFSMVNGKRYWRNGITNDTNRVDTTQTTPLVSNNGWSIGRYVALSTSAYFNGDIAEIIIFSRALKDEERQSIEAYLSKKYGIKLI